MQPFRAVGGQDWPRRGRGLCPLSPGEGRSKIKGGRKRPGYNERNFDPIGFDNCCFIDGPAEARTFLWSSAQGPGQGRQAVRLQWVLLGFLLSGVALGVGMLPPPADAQPSQPRPTRSGQGVG